MDPKAVKYINEMLKAKKDKTGFKSIVFFGVSLIFTFLGFKYLKQSCKYDGAMIAYNSVKDDTWEDE